MVTLQEPFRHVQDLNVYQRLFRLAKVVVLKVIPKLPPEEKFDLVDQLRRACKAPTAILSEGFPKRFQPRHWDKYITDALGECEEMVTHLLYVKELYGARINSASVQVLIDEYRHAINQLHALSKAWSKFKRKKDKK